MAIVVGTNSYATEDEFLGYAEARGVVTFTKPLEVLLTLAMDWVEVQPFVGWKTDVDQALAFPRNGRTTVPAKVKEAQLACALLINSGVDPHAPEQDVKREKLGPMETEYHDRPSGKTPGPLARIRGLLMDHLGASSTLTRG